MAHVSLEVIHRLAGDNAVRDMPRCGRFRRRREFAYMQHKRTSEQGKRGIAEPILRLDDVVHRSGQHKIEYAYSEVRSRHEPLSGGLVHHVHRAATPAPSGSARCLEAVDKDICRRQLVIAGRQIAFLGTTLANQCLRRSEQRNCSRQKRSLAPPYPFHSCFISLPWSTPSQMSRMTFLPLGPVSFLSGIGMFACSLPDDSGFGW